MPKPTATEPKVRVARDGKDPSRTYRYLLESPYEMELLEHLLTGQLALIDVADGTVTKVGPPAMIRSVNVARERAVPRQHGEEAVLVLRPVPAVRGDRGHLGRGGQIAVHALRPEPSRDGAAADGGDQPGPDRRSQGPPDGRGAHGGTRRGAGPNQPAADGRSAHRSEDRPNTGPPIRTTRASPPRRSTRTRSAI